MRLLIQPLEESDPFIVEAKRGDTIQVLKCKIAAFRPDLPAASLYLVHNGVALENDNISLEAQGLTSSDQFVVAFSGEVEDVRENASIAGASDLDRSTTVASEEDCSATTGASDQERSARAEEEEEEEEERRAAEIEAARGAEQERLFAEAEACRKAEEQRLAAEAESARLAAEAARLAEEERSARAEEERRAGQTDAAQRAEHKRMVTKADRLVAKAKAGIEAARLAEEERSARAERAAQAAASRNVEDKRLVAAEAEAYRKEEEQRLAAEAEEARLAEKARLQARAERAAQAGEERRAREKRLAAEAEASRKAEEQRLAAEAEEARLAAEAHAARLSAKAERRTQAERAAQAGEARRVEEKRLAAEAEASRKAEEQRLAAEAESARLAAEAARFVEEERSASAAKKAEDETPLSTAASSFNQPFLPPIRIAMNDNGMRSSSAVEVRAIPAPIAVRTCAGASSEPAIPSSTCSATVPDQAAKEKPRSNEVLSGSMGEVSYYAAESFFIGDDSSVAPTSRPSSPHSLHEADSPNGFFSQWQGSIDQDADEDRQPFGFSSRDEDAMQRLWALGFDPQQVRETYVVCDRNEVSAAWRLIELAGNIRRVTQPSPLFQQVFDTPGFSKLAEMLAHNSNLLEHIVPILAESQPEIAESIRSDSFIFLQMAYIWQARSRDRRRRSDNTGLRLRPSEGNRDNDLNDIFDSLTEDPSFPELARYVVQYPEMVVRLVGILSESHPEVSRAIAFNPPRFLDIAYMAIAANPGLHEAGSLASRSNLMHDADGFGTPARDFISHLTDDEWAKTRTLMMSGFHMHLAVHASCFILEDWEAMDRIVAMGFNQNAAVQAYIQCNKSEDDAVGHLFQQQTHPPA